MSQIMKFLIKVIKYINISLSKPFNIIFHSLITFQFNFKLKLKKKLIKEIIKKRIKKETFNYPFKSQIIKFVIEVIKYINISILK